MKAIFYTAYGSPDVLELAEVEKPTPKDNEVLVRVRATSVNASDWEILTGKPFYARLYGLFKPRFNILGSDIAGVVESVGSDVQQIKPGDEVFGDIMQRLGGFAEYVCAPASALAPKPADITFAEAATLPQAATVALQGVRDKGRVAPGHKVLINGAGGAVGTFAIQIAKMLGAEVTGVDSAAKSEMLRSIGADHVIDYAAEDFTQNSQRYDLILDVVGNRSIFSLKRSLSDRGVYSVVGGRVLEALFVGTAVALTGSKSMGVLAWKPNTTDLEYVAELCQAGTITPVIDKRYELHETPDALRRLGERKTEGIGVVTLP